ncbi:membrane protein [gut metagenome]|uniref:Membrane protein n=1 Tax=gut metagenome TaxID=749906 RepID=J9GHL2_9ZZZZ
MIFIIFLYSVANVLISLFLFQSFSLADNIYITTINIFCQQLFYFFYKIFFLFFLILFFLIYYKN